MFVIAPRISFRIWWTPHIRNARNPHCGEPWPTKTRVAGGGGVAGGEGGEGDGGVDGGRVVEESTGVEWGRRWVEADWGSWRGRGGRS